MEHDIRPWGEYFVLEDTLTHKVKRIVVNSGQRLSYQYHNHRSEVWTIVEGEGALTIDDRTYTVRSGEVVCIGQGQKHRIMNTSLFPLVFIEVQLGTYFGEDDIVRLSDDYNRVDNN